MVLTFSKLALANAAIALVLVHHADASPLTVNPVTLLPTVSILNNQNPAFGGPPSRDMVRVAVFEDPTLTRAEVYEEIARNTTSSSPSTTSSTPNASGFDASSSPPTVPTAGSGITSSPPTVSTAGSGITSSPPPANASTTDRRLEVTSVDVQRLEEHFQQPMVVNLNTIKQLYNKAGFQPAPWPSGYWPTYQDSINAKWDGIQPSPAEKYAKAYGLDVKTFMDKVSRYNGIDTQIGTPSCTSNSQCVSRNDGSVCAKRTGATTGYCVAQWWGICHAWAPAAILEREPRCNVVKNGVTFKPFDIKGLITAAYDGSYIPVVFTGARYDGGGSPRDEYGRLTDAKERDLGPGYFHIAVTNIMGRYKMSFVVDVASGAPVWNQPVRSYEITETTEMTPAAAAVKYFNVPKYPFNDAAKSIAFVRMTFRYINEMVRDGPLVETGIVDQATLTNYYTYLLELDAQKNIIGGEWVYGSQTNHPDFLWFATQKPAANAVTAVGISYQNVVDLLQQSIACGTTPTPTTPTPTTPTPTTPTPTTPTPTTPTPTTPTPTTPTPTTPTPTTSSPPASGGPCGNALVGPQPCPVGEYCQPWDPWFYQCRKVDAKCGVQEVGVDFYGDDLASFQLLLPEQCCDKCVATAGCKAYTFVNYNADGKAYCYLKKGTGQKSNKAGVVSATIATTTTPTPTTPTPTTMSPPASGGPCGNAQVGPQPCPAGEYCQPWDPWFYQCRKLPAKCGVQEVGVDYYGDDLASFQLLLPEDCCEKCAATVGCKAYTFVNYNADGKAYCFLKKGSGVKSNKAGVVSATIASSPPPTCPTPAWGNCGNGAAGATCCPSGFYCQPWDALYYQCIQSPTKCSRQFAATDFYGDDLAVVYGIGPGECCDKCAATVGCMAYTFVNNNVPTPACYLKKGSGQQRTNPSAVSALLN